MRCTLVPMSGVGSPVDPAPTPEHVAFASRLSGNWVHLVRFTPPQLRYVTFTPPQLSSSANSCKGTARTGPPPAGGRGGGARAGRAGRAGACTGCAAQLRHACHLELCDASEVHCLLAPTAHVGSLEMAHKPHRWPRGLEGGCQASAYPDTPLAPFGVPLVATAVASLCSPRWGRHTLWTPDCVDAMARPWPHAMDATVGLAWRSRPVGTLVSGRHVVISPLVVDTEVANCGRQQLTFGLLLACLWLASGGLGHPSSDSSTSGPMPWRRCLSGRHVAYCLARGPSGGLPMWAGLFHAAPARFLRCLHCNRHCGGMRRHCDGTSGCGGTSARKAPSPTI